jgi:hypothetical protein
MATTTTAADLPGTLRTGDAMPVAEAAPRRGGMFGGRDKRKGEVAAGGNRTGMFAVNPKARIGLMITQILTAIAFTIVLGGLASLQKQANTVSLPLPQQQALYIETFQAGGVRPYPGNGRYQFGLQWWILMFEIFIFMMIFVLLVMPRQLLRLKHAAMALLVYVFVLTTLQIDSLLYFNRSPVADSVYGSTRIKVTLAGSIMGAICNGFSIILLGLLREDHLHGHHGYGGVGGKQVGIEPAAAHGPAAV